MQCGACGGCAYVLHQSGAGIFEAAELSPIIGAGVALKVKIYAVLILTISSQQPGRKPHESQCP